ncbi:MAG: DUF4097 family beta strand repeat-containing protein [Gemmatimonadales bacterium]
MRFQLLLSALLLPASLAAQATATRSLPLNADAAVKIHNMTGPVVVHAWAEDSIKVNSTGNRGRLFMGGSRRGVKLGYETPPDVKGSGSLEIWLPATARLWVMTAAGRVTISGMNGTVEVASTSGDISITGAPREVRAESMDGKVTLDVRSTWVRSRTASGAINLTGSAGNVVAESVSGDVEVAMLGVRRARLESVTGDIRWLGTLDDDASLDVETHAGAIEVRLEPALTMQLDVNAYQSAIRNDYAASATISSTGGQGSELHYTRGDSGADVTVRTFKGTVLLAPRKDMASQ